MKAVQHSIQVDTTIGECSFNRSFQMMGRIAFMKHQDAHKLLNTTTICPALFKLAEHLMVNKRPVFLPPLHRLGIIKGSWLFFKQRQIVERIKDILFASITASMARQLLLSIENLDGKGIGLHRHGSACLFDWDRIAVGFILSLRIRGESDGNSITTVVVVRGKRQEERLLLLPCFSN